MPVPTAPTAFTITPLVTGSAGATLAWSHAGTNLDRFQIVYKKPTDTNWRKLVVGPAADFGAGPYSFVTASGEDFVWKVIALGTAGERSTTNPTATFTTNIDGIWLLPLSRTGGLTANKEAWIGGRHPNEDYDQSRADFASPYSREEFSQVGVLHLAKGVLDGLILERHGVTGAGWFERLRNLIKSQRKYERVVLATPRDFFNVELGALSGSPTIAGGHAWEVSVPYRQLT